MALVEHRPGVVGPSAADVYGERAVRCRGEPERPVDVPRHGPRLLAAHAEADRRPRLERCRAQLQPRGLVAYRVEPGLPVARESEREAGPRRADGLPRCGQGERPVRRAEQVGAVLEGVFGYDRRYWRLRILGCEVEPRRPLVARYHRDVCRCS